MLAMRSPISSSAFPATASRSFPSLSATFAAAVSA
jgi:hypothetical protein